MSEIDKIRYWRSHSE